MLNRNAEPQVQGLIMQKRGVEKSDDMAPSSCGQVPLGTSLVGGYARQAR